MKQKISVEGWRIPRLSKAGWLRHQENVPVPLKAQTGRLVNIAKASIKMLAKRTDWKGALRGHFSWLRICWSITPSAQFWKLMRAATPPVQEGNTLSAPAGVFHQCKMANIQRWSNAWRCFNQSADCAVSA